jgi:hypothetical protein
MPTTKQLTIGDEACMHFLVQLAAVQTECPAERIVQFDESSWRLVMVSEQSIAEPGAEVIPRFTGTALYRCFIFFAICAAHGSKFPLILMAKGPTEHCHKQFSSVGRWHEIWHSPNGWRRGDLDVDDLCWLRN